MIDRHGTSDAPDTDLHFTLIDIRDEWQCRYWARRFGVRPKQLKRAVRVVGNRTENVILYLDVLHRGLTIAQKVDLLEMLFGGIFPKRPAPNVDASAIRARHDASSEAVPAVTEREVGPR
jgi:hypothetical protein